MLRFLGGVAAEHCCRFERPTAYASDARATVHNMQDRTVRYIARLGKELVDMLFSTESMADTVDLSLLKCRERDQLEEVFKSWSCDVPCNSECTRHCLLHHQ